MSDTHVTMEWTKCVACQSPMGELCVSFDLDLSLCKSHWVLLMRVVSWEGNRVIAEAFEVGVERDLTAELA